MSTRRRALLITAACGLVAALFAAGPASAGTPIDYTVPDSVGEAPQVVDITKVRVYATKADYRATLSYRDLKPRAATRWVISFYDDGARRGDPSVSRSGNAVEVRVTPGGVLKTKAFDLYSDDSYEKSGCAGVTATPSWNLDKIRVVVPTSCWNLTAGQASVRAESRAFTPQEGWSTDLYDMSDGSKTDYLYFSWNYSPF